jgi:transposase
MIPDELVADILRLHYAEKWPFGTIARHLRVHHSTVRRVLAQAGAVDPMRSERSSMVDPFVPFILQTLEKYPRLAASRLFTMVKERGYPGRSDHFRSIVARLRPKKPAEAYLRLRTLPGEQAQVDWGHFGKLTIGRALRPLMAFVMVLSFSRLTFLRFYLDAQMPNFIRGHVDAFAFFQGTARVLLYDNLKSAVLERQGDAIRFHPKLLELAGHYRFEPRPVAPARGNEKGRVERKIRDIRQSFFAARQFADVADLNAQAFAWCTGLAADRPCPEDRAKTVRDVFTEEKHRLLPLPEVPFETCERVEVSVGKVPYARFDRNDYSVPHTRNDRTLTVLADLTTVRILDGTELVASHPRSFDKGAQVEDPTHIEALRQHKRQGKAESVRDYLHRAAPSVAPLLERVAERGGNIGSMTAHLHRLLDAHGAATLERAIAGAMAQDLPHLGAIRQLLDIYRQDRGLPPPISSRLSDDPRVRELHVKPHNLDDYDELTQDDDDDDHNAN